MENNSDIGFLRISPFSAEADRKSWEKCQQGGRWFRNWNIRVNYFCSCTCHCVAERKSAKSIADHHDMFSWVRHMAILRWDMAAAIKQAVCIILSAHSWELFSRLSFLCLLVCILPSMDLSIFLLLLSFLLLFFLVSPWFYLEIRF